MGSTNPETMGCTRSDIPVVCEATLVLRDEEIERLKKALADQRLLTEEVCQVGLPTPFELFGKGKESRQGKGIIWPM